MQFQDCETSHASVRVTRRIMKFSWRQRSLNGKKETRLVRWRDGERPAGRKRRGGRERKMRVEARSERKAKQKRGATGVKRQKSREAR